MNACWDPSNITNYSITNNGKLLTKTSVTGWNEAVFLKASIMQKQVYRFKVVLSHGFGQCSFIGVAPDTSLYNGQLWMSHWSYDSACGELRVKGSATANGITAHSGEEFTISLDPGKKALTFSKGGVTIGNPISLDCSETDFQKLRPIAQMYDQGDALEVLS